MPQDRISGADADRYGRETARRVAIVIGATSISETSNEFELDNRKITIRCARKRTKNIGTPYKLLKRVSAVVAALEQESGDYKLYEISPKQFKKNMRPTRSTGPSAGRVGLVRKSVFVNKGKFNQNVSLKINAVENKIARICWNTMGWKFPSGPLGKSSDPKSYEAQYGYGHEEWLFDRYRIIEGYHYSFLEPLNVESGKHFGKVYNISLFTVNGIGKKFYVGDIRNALCISKEEAEKAYCIYEKNGWIKEMTDDIHRVGVDSDSFLKNLPKYIFNVKFKFEDVTKHDEPEEISKEDINITTNRFRLLSKKTDFLINEVVADDEPDGEFRNEAPRKVVIKKEVEYDPYHSKMQNALKKILQKSYKDEYDKVCIEKSRIDIKARTKSKKWHYFEIKTDTPKICIRGALGQIMEYAYWPESERAEKLIIIGDTSPDNDAKRYIQHIRDKFHIPVYYRSLDIDRKVLSRDF